MKVLTHLEENGVVLLNLKPTNIFTNDDKTFKIGGLARTDNNIWLNTEYLAPELKEDLEKNPKSLPHNLNKSYSKKKAAVYTLGKFWSGEMGWLYKYHFIELFKNIYRFNPFGDCITWEFR